MQQLAASTRDRDIYSQTINLSELFRADTFLNALRQQTARETKQPMDTLVLSTAWSGDVKQGKNVSIKISGLQLEGCSFDGGRLSESAPDAPSVIALPACSIAWIPRVGCLCTDKLLSQVHFVAGRGTARNTRGHLTPGLLQCGSRQDGHPIERAVQ